jgi:hypothetical protein
LLGIRYIPSSTLTKQNESKRYMINYILTIGFYISIHIPKRYFNLLKYVHVHMCVYTFMSSAIHNSNKSNILFGDTS